MARIKGKYRAVIELELDTQVTENMLPFKEIKYQWEKELSGYIQSEVRDFADPASCKVTQEIAEIELVEE
jgi:hypothetical protein